jgi:hypothetical protein
MNISQLFQVTGVNGQTLHKVKVMESGTPVAMPFADIPVPSKCRRRQNPVRIICYFGL